VIAPTALDPYVPERDNASFMLAIDLSRKAARGVFARFPVHPTERVPDPGSSFFKGMCSPCPNDSDEKSSYGIRNPPKVPPRTVGTMGRTALQEDAGDARKSLGRSGTLQSRLRFFRLRSHAASTTHGTNLVEHWQSCLEKHPAHAFRRMNIKKYVFEKKQKFSA